jgi:hypothetical protein
MMMMMMKSVTVRTRGERLFYRLTRLNMQQYGTVIAVAGIKLGRR